MKLKLYIDFDGVILNTIDISYAMLKERNIDTTSLEVQDFYLNLDWKDLLERSSPIHNSIDNLKRLIDSDLYDVQILTHVNSKLESTYKEEYLQQYIPNIEMIFVDKRLEKCDVVDCKNAILVDDYMGNLTLWEEKGGIPVKFSTSGKRYDYISISSLDMMLDKYEEIMKLIEVKS